MKRKRKIKLGKRIAEQLELPAEAASPSAKITLWGKEMVLLERHKGLFECSERRIRLHTADGIVCIAGESLVLMELSLDRMFISGAIENIGYEA